MYKESMRKLKFTPVKFVTVALQPCSVCKDMRRGLMYRLRGNFLAVNAAESFTLLSGSKNTSKTFTEMKWIYFVLSVMHLSLQEKAWFNM